MGVGEAKIKALAKANDLKRRLLSAPQGLNKRCFLLDRAGETKRFTIVAELLSGWKMYYNEFRGQMTLEHATLDPDFNDLYARMSWVAYGEPAGSGGNILDVYSTLPSREDVIAPTTDSPYWKVYLTRAAKERFTII